MLNLNKNFPREDGRLVGLYIETKQFGFYLENYGVNIAEELFKILKKFDIETIDKSAKKLPIIIQSFEKDALLYFSQISDLPRVQLMFWKNGYVHYNLTEISKYAHGVGPYGDQLFTYLYSINFL